MSKPKENYQYNPKKRKLAKIYSRQKFFMSLGNGIILPLIVISLLFFTGLLESAANFALSHGKLAGILIFILMFNILLQILEFPVHLYGNFIYEHKYNMSNQKFSEWMKDYGKETLISYLTGLPIQFAVAWLITSTNNWWIYVVIVTVLFDIFLNFIYPVVIVPFLYKLEPYKDKKELKIIFEILRKSGAKDIKIIKIQKESEKSNKVNAFFSGIGATKMIVLYDNLIKNFTKREVRTVIAHELGHYVHKDVIKTIFSDAIKSLLVYFLVDKLIRNIFSIETNIPLYLVPVITAVLIILGLLIMPILMLYSRYLENKADIFALDAVKDPAAQISTERRLADHDLLDEKPNKFVEFWFWSHPCPEERIRRVHAWMKDNKIKS